MRVPFVGPGWRRGAITTLGFCGSAVAVPLHAQAPQRPIPEILVDGERADLSGVTFIAVCKPGEILVGVPREHAVRRYGTSGRSTGSFGRKGAGPGEIMQLGMFPICSGDSLVIADNALGRLTVIGPDLKLGRTAMWPSVGQGSLPRTTGVLTGMVPRGAATSGVVMGATRQDGPDRAEATVIRMGWDGSRPREVLSVSVFPSRCLLRPPGGGDFSALFCAISWYSVSPRGTYAVSVSASAEQQDRGGFWIRIAQTDGSSGIDREIVTEVESLRSDAVEREIEQMKPSTRRLEALRSVPTPKRYPFTIGILVGDDGTAWVEHLGRSERRWTIVSRTGIKVGQVAVPDDLRLLSVLGTTALGTRQDANGFESIVRIQFRSPGVTRP